MDIARSALALLTLSLAANAQVTRYLEVKSFSVGPDQTLTYPNKAPSPYLVDLPDEHTTFIPPAGGSSTWLVFGASKIAGGTGGAVVLETTDLKNFAFASSLGYNPQVMAPAIGFTECNPFYDTEFDENYAAPGSVVQDPTLPAGNLIMFYEAENHCPGDVNQQPFYATVGFARSSDNGKTWPAAVNSPTGGPARHPVLQSSDPQPVTAHLPMGNAIPSAFVDARPGGRDAIGNPYVYVVYEYRSTSGTGGSGGVIRVARARLGSDSLSFEKWYSGSFSQTGVGGSDTAVLPSTGCPGGTGVNPEISYNDDLGMYLMIYACPSGPTGARVGAWYYSTATSLDLEDWTTPQMVLNSQFSVTAPCPGNTAGSQFDGWYPSTMSPGADAGHTRLTGNIFFLNGCNVGARTFMSRAFTITTQPAAVVRGGPHRR